MEFSYLFKIVLYGILCIGSTAPLIALCVYIFQAIRNGRGLHPILILDKIAEQFDWKGKTFLSLAAIGLLLCMYQGAEAMLFWMPDSWGRFSEDEHTTYRSLLAGFFATFSGYSLILLIEEAISNRVLLQINAMLLEGHSLTKEAKSPDALKANFRDKIGELEMEYPSFTNLERLLAKKLEMRACRILLQYIEEREEQKAAYRSGTPPVTITQGPFYMLPPFGDTLIHPDNIKVRRTP